MKNNLFTAISLLIGTTIGAGFLGIPYVFAQSGFLIGAINLVLIVAIMLLINLYLGEISIRTKGSHQLTGYAKIYSGIIGKKLMFFSMIFGIYSAILAYIIAEGESLSLLIFGTTSSSFVIGIIFWLIMSLIALSGLKSLRKYEPVSVSLTLLLGLLIILIFLGKINLNNLAYINTKNYFLPFGVILFSMLSFSILPEIEIVLKGNEKKMKKTILIGTLIPALFYIFFALCISGTFGLQTPEIATLALGKIFVCLGILAMFTAYLGLSISLEDMYILDYKFSKRKSWLITTLIPLMLYIILKLIEKNSFVTILSIAGIVSGGLTGILILLMNIKAKKQGSRKPEYSVPINWLVIIIISAVFILAAVLEILKLL